MFPRVNLNQRHAIDWEKSEKDKLGASFTNGPAKTGQEFLHCYSSVYFQGPKHPLPSLNLSAGGGSSLSRHRDIWCLCRNTFFSCRKEFAGLLIIASDWADKYILEMVWTCIFLHFYCCSSTCLRITLKNGTVRPVKWNHILHVAKRAPRIENDHIMCFQIASLKGIRVWPACVSYYTEEKNCKRSLLEDLRGKCWSFVCFF